MKDWLGSNFIINIRYANENLNANENRNLPVNNEDEEMDENYKRILEISKHQK